MPSEMNQLVRATAAQSKIRRLGYLPQALSSAAFHASMLDSAYGPYASSDLTLTHITGSPRATDIISLILVVNPTLEPTATLAVSLVPSAMTQQPRKPDLTRSRA